MIIGIISFIIIGFAVGCLIVGFVSESKPKRLENQKIKREQFLNSIRGKEIYYDVIHPDWSVYYCNIFIIDCLNKKNIGRTTCYETKSAAVQDAELRIKELKKELEMADDNKQQYFRIDK